MYGGGVVYGYYPDIVFLHAMKLPTIVWYCSSHVWSKVEAGSLEHTPVFNSKWGRPTVNTVGGSQQHTFANNGWDIVWCDVRFSYHGLW
jgi:hypothetical protein